MVDDPLPAPPREPEIELLATIARRGLRTLRAAFWLAGAAAIGFGCWRSATPPIDDAGLAGAAPNALGVVWLCAGLPLVARADWLFGRGRWPALAGGALLWFGAILLPHDHRYGFVLRAFASLVACLSLLVWRTLWRLTVPAGGATSRLPAGRSPA